MIFQNPALNTAATYILYAGLFILTVLFLFCIIRSIRGPRIADRLLSINMIGTMTMAAIAIVAVLYSLDYLVDISLLYAMISFLAVVVLSRIYRGVYLAAKDAAAKPQGEYENNPETEGRHSD